MVTFEELGAESARRHRGELAALYHANMRTWSCVEACPYEQAYAKIGDLMAHLEAGTCVAFAAFEGSEVVGFVWAYPHEFRDERRMYVSELGVSEGHRGRGIGRALMALVEERAKEMGLPALYLHAEAGSPVAVRFYEGLGYGTERIQLRKAIAADRGPADLS